MQLLCVCVAVKVLQAISDKLENLNWTVTQHSCVEDGGFNGKMHTDDDTVRNVTCDCKFQNNTVCHVDNMYVFFWLLMLYI